MYLQAWYAWEKTTVASVTASTAAVNAAVDEVVDDCPAVLAHAPLPADSPPRETKQLLDINAELTAMVLTAWIQPDRQALTTFVATTSRVRWTSTQLTYFIHRKVLHYANSFTGSASMLCIDMKHWVQSGYTELGRGTKALVRQRSAYRTLLRQTPKGVRQHLYLYYENASERLLTRRLNALAEKFIRKARSPIDSAIQRIAQATGYP